MNKKFLNYVMLILVLLINCLQGVSNSEILTENKLPTSMGWAASPFPRGLFISFELPTTPKHSIGLNMGRFDKDFYANDESAEKYYISYEVNFLEHLGSQKTNIGWFYRGFGIGGYSFYKIGRYEAVYSKIFLSLFLGRRQEFKFANIYAEIYFMLGADGVHPLLRCGFKIDMDKFPVIPIPYV